ncbi:MAG: hypothetical protein [Bacteriophage sp.]|nr:MAG: hypothetical protein [Bacteriophage sp.]
MNTKHAPGPWNNYMGDDIYCVYDCNGRKICTIEKVDIVGWNARFRDESEANEALIAAAPTMLDALIAADLAMAQGGILSCHATRKEIHAAIAKATGEQQ